MARSRAYLKNGKRPLKREGAEVAGFRPRDCPRGPCLHTQSCEIAPPRAGSRSAGPHATSLGS
jgi:hypothetical protein